MKDKVQVLIFIFIISLGFILNVFLPDKEISNTERRKLESFPKITTKNILDASFFNNFDTYTTDQFVGRDYFRKIKANFSYNILNNKDNNGIFVYDDNIFKLEYPLNEKNVNRNTEKINNIVNKYFITNKIYYSVIPDKNYYLNNDDYLKMDYNYMFNLINTKLNKYDYIDITNTLTLEDYYKTDPHFKQENLEKTVKTIIENMGLTYRNITYKKNILDDFYGAYYGQLGTKFESETLTFLTNNILDNVKVEYLENKNLTSLYNLEKYNSLDPYEIYLDGASALIKITNENYFNEKDLIVFRDSFGSSLIPLLTPYFKTITVVDIRYINSNLLENYISVEDADVLFIYSTLILNGNAFK